MLLFYAVCKGQEHFLLILIKVITPPYYKDIHIFLLRGCLVCAEIHLNSPWPLTENGPVWRDKKWATCTDVEGSSSQLLVPLQFPCSESYRFLSSLMYRETLVLYEQNAHSCLCQTNAVVNVPFYFKDHMWLIWAICTVSQHMAER